MIVRLHQLSVSRGLALALCCAAIAPATRAADGIQFSRPDVEFAAPTSRNPNLPTQERSGLKSLDFGDAQPRIYLPPPVRAEPRRKVEKKTVFDEPKIFSDRGKEKSDQDENSDKEGSPKDQRSQDEKRSAMAARPSWLTDNKADAAEKRALTPVEDFDWKPESERTKKEGGLFGSSTSVGTKTTDDRWVISGPHGPEDSTERNTAISFFGVISAAENKELTRERMERRVEFEKLLGGPSPAFVRIPETFAASLDPITSPFATPQDVAPTPGVPLRAEPVRPLAPAQAFGAPQRSWQAPSMDEAARRFSSPAVPRGAPTLEASRQQRPLMNQPTVLEFPTRKF